MSMSTQASKPEVPAAIAPRPGWRRRSWLLVVPVLGALAFGGIKMSTASAQTSDAGSEAGPGFRARRLQRLLDKVGASDSQRSQIQGIWAGLRPQLKSLRQQHVALRNQMKTALTGSTIVPADVENLRQQSMALADKTSALFTQGIVATAQVLTPDQRKTAAQELEAHKGRHHFGPPPAGE